MSIHPATARTVDLQASGLLWLINACVLHPRGYALAADPNHPIEIVLLGDGQEIVTFADSMHETIDGRFAEVNKLLAPRDVNLTDPETVVIPLPPDLPPTLSGTQPRFRPEIVKNAVYSPGETVDEGEPCPLCGKVSDGTHEPGVSPSCNPNTTDENEENE